MSDHDNDEDYWLRVSLDCSDSRSCSGVLVGDESGNEKKRKIE